MDDRPAPTRTTSHVKGLHDNGGGHRGKQVLDGQDEPGWIVALIHDDSPTLEGMAVFDTLVNNAAKARSTILTLGNGHRHDVDHGLAFQQEPQATDGAVGVDR